MSKNALVLVILASLLISLALCVGCDVEPKNEAGNPAEENSLPPSDTGGIPGDTTAPVISSAKATEITATSVKIAWLTDEPSSSGVEYGLTSDYGSAYPSDANLVTSHSIVLSGLASGTTYHFRAKSRDASGNESVGGDISFTTAPPDVTAPVISKVEPTEITEGTAKITWTTDELATSQVEYGLTAAYGLSSSKSTAMLTSHSITITGLNSGATYHYRVNSTDAGGNLSVSGDYVFTTPDLTPPRVSDVLISDIAEDGATITWRTDEEATCKIDYGYNHGSSTSTGTGRMHTVTLSSLTPGTIWQFRIGAVDSRGNAVTTGDYKFTTASTGDSSVQITQIFYDGLVYRTEADEYVEITNTGLAAQNMEGWVLRDISEGYPSFTFPAYLLAPGQTIRVYTDEIHPEWGRFSFGYGRAIWNNTSPDTGALFDAQGTEVSRRSY